MNYLRSELYRNLHSRGLKIAGVCMLGICVAVIGILTFFRQIDTTFRYANWQYALSLFYCSAGSFLYLAVMLEYFIDNNEKKEQTVKHSLSFGITRKKIYALRYVDAAAVSSVYFAVLGGSIALLTYVFLEPSDPKVWGYYGRMLLGIYPLLLGALALTHCFVMNMENANISIVPVISILTVLPQVLEMAGMKFPFLAKIARYMPNALAQMGIDMEGTGGLSFTWDTAAGIGKCWLVGIAWIVIFGLIGYFWYRKKEIK
ncbi:MAG: ABC transporter permease [Eubacteriales bacterium]|nr:ABC transporter permease [Eubacteriales bacterium]